MSKVIAPDKIEAYVNNYISNGRNKTIAYMQTYKVDYEQANAHCSDAFERVVKSGNNMVKELFNADETKRKIIKAQKKFEKEKDNTNYSRMIELEAKMSCPELRRQEITNTNPEKVLIIYNDKTLPLENRVLSDEKINNKLT